MLSFIASNLVSARRSRQHAHSITSTQLHGGIGSGGLTSGSGSLSAEMALWEVQWEELAIERRVGKGSFGRVYAARWRETDVAVKVLLDYKDDCEDSNASLQLPPVAMTRLQEVRGDG